MLSGFALAECPIRHRLGQGANAKGQFYAGETVSFTGPASEGSGSTISFTANPGFVVSAGGHQGGWGQQNLACNIHSGG